MGTRTDRRLEQAVATLNDLIALAHSLELPDSAQFLSMAKLSLQIDLNGIAEGEFRAFCVALEDAGDETAARRCPASSERRPRFNEDRLPRKNVRGGNGLAALQASRTRVKQ